MVLSYNTYCMQTIATITPKFQIHIPKEIRQKSGILEHGPVIMRADNGKIVIEKKKTKSIMDLAGSFEVENPIPADKVRDHIEYSS